MSVPIAPAELCTITLDSDDDRWIYQELRLSGSSAKGSDREVKRRRRMDGILAAAMDLFVEVGPVKFSARAVAAKAGCRLNIVQHYFGTAEELLVATIDAFIGRYTSRFCEIYSWKHLSAMERLDIIIDENIKASTIGDGPSFIFEAGALARRNPLIADVVGRQYNYTVRLIGLLISQLPSAPSLEVAISKSIAIVSQMEGLLFVRFAVSSEELNSRVIKIIKESISSTLSQPFPEHVKASKTNIF